MTSSRTGLVSSRGDVSSPEGRNAAAFAHPALICFLLGLFPVISQLPWREYHVEYHNGPVVLHWRRPRTRPISTPRRIRIAVYSGVSDSSKRRTARYDYVPYDYILLGPLDLLHEAYQVASDQVAIMQVAGQPSFMYIRYSWLTRAGLKDGDRRFPPITTYSFGGRSWVR